MLISSKMKDGSLWFEVHKEGLLFLRKFRNKRLRIIFNVTHENIQLDQFNHLFIGSQECKNRTANKLDNSNVSQLRISQYYKELPDNRVLIFLNAFEKPEATHLLVLGYLVASVFFYHNSQPLAEDSNLTKMLAFLKQLLEGTQVHQLQEQIKYKSGFAKKPYFMCLFHHKQPKKEDNYHDYFRQFYKYQENKNIINQSVDALIDYFPQRSALDIHNFKCNADTRNRIHKLSLQFIQNILGRQIFNFQITGLTVQNLCFELSQIFNLKSKSIDLVKIYNKIINNQKIQVLDSCIQKYSNLAINLEKGMPYEMPQLLQSHSRIQKFIIQESMADARNCMIFNEYEAIHQKLTGMMQKKIKQMKDRNKQLLRNKVLACYETIEQDKQMQQLLNNINDDNIEQITLTMEQKISTFIQQNILQFNICDMLGRIISKYFENLRQSLTHHIKAKSSCGGQLNQRINKLTTENKTLQSKCRQLENQFIYLNQVNTQLKHKLLGLQNNGQITQPISENTDSQLILQMKKRILDLETQLADKNNLINNLNAIFDKFQGQFCRKYSKPKFNKQVQNLLLDVSNKVNQLHTLFNQLKKTETYYKQIQTQFQNKKKKIDKQRLTQIQQKMQLKQKLNQAAKQRKCIEETLEQSRSTINILKNVQRQSKQGINNLQNGSSKLKCFLAQTQNQLENYKKALELVALYCMTGKSEKLKDFVKVSNQQQLKQILKQILKK